MRLLLFTGKGGVGKTTLAAATASAIAEHGKRTLVVSTDPAHSLADVFSVPLGDQPRQVQARLHAVQIDARRLLDAQWHELRESLRDSLLGAGVDALDAAEMTLLPGVDELLALGEVQRYAASGYFHAVVVDCGPTAETLRLLALPEAIAGYLPRLAGMAWPRRANGLASPLRRLADHLAGLRELLTDPETTAVRLVFTPQRMVLAETRRTLSALALRGIRVDGLVANRLVPRPRSRFGSRRGSGAAWMRGRRAEQDAVLAELAGPGMPPVRTAAHRAAEPVGAAALAGLAAELYDGGDPLAADAPPGGPLLDVRRCGAGEFRLRVSFPLDPGAAVELARVDDELAITVAGYRRLVALPELLRPCTITGAESDTRGLVITLDGAGE